MCETANNLKWLGVGTKEDGVAWLNLDKLSKFSWFMIKVFAYDQITNDEIESALASELLPKVDPTLEWQDDYFLSETEEIPDSLKHSFRVAALTNQIKNIGFNGSIILDLLDWVNMRTPSCIADGNHQIRALQFLGVDNVSFSISGDVKLIEKLVWKCGVNSSPIE